MTLNVHSVSRYLTNNDSDIKWRAIDYNANKLVKIFKGVDFKGYIPLKDPKTNRITRISVNNKKIVYDIVIKNLANKIKSIYNEKIVLVPVPNSSAIEGSGHYNTLGIAKDISENSDGTIDTVDALRWKNNLGKAHEGGPRSPAILEPNLRLSNDILEYETKIAVLFDDVCTTGGHLIACARKLRKAGFLVDDAVCISQTTDTQHAKMIELFSFKLEDASSTNCN